VPAFYESWQRRYPAPVARGRETGDPIRGAAVLSPQDGQGIRDEDVRARDRIANTHAVTLIESAKPHSRGPAHEIPICCGGREPAQRCHLAIEGGRLRPCLESRSSSLGARSAAPRRSPNPEARRKYCRDCWDKKIAVEEVVAREFALKRYIRAHNAEKYLIYHSTLKRPCGQLIVVDDGYDLFLTLVLYPSFAWDEPAYHLEGDPEGRLFSEILVDVVATEVIERGVAANGTWRSSGRPVPSRKTGTVKCRRRRPVLLRASGFGDIITQTLSSDFVYISGGMCMSCARYFFVATFVGASFVADATLAAQATAAKAPPPMTPILAGKSSRPP